MISSPGLRLRKMTSSAAIPELTANACFALLIFAM